MKNKAILVRVILKKGKDIMINQEIDDLKDTLYEIGINDPGNTCKEFFCSTCGGVRGRIIDNIDPATIKRISNVLKLIEMQDLKVFGELESVISQCDTDGYTSIFMREAERLDWSRPYRVSEFIRKASWINEYSGNDKFTSLYEKIRKRYQLEEKAVSIHKAKNLDWSNLDDVDRFIFDNRKYSINDEFSLLYRKILERAAKEAVLNSHEPLAETLILTLKKRTMDYPELLGYALHVSIHNNQMKRVLYNTLREYIDEVKWF
jgi:hypothetical protein